MMLVILERIVDICILFVNMNFINFLIVIK